MSPIEFKDAAPGLRVRQEDWLLRPLGYRDGVILRVVEAAPGTPHGWVHVQFEDPRPCVLRCSTAQLKRLTP